MGDDAEILLQAIFSKNKKPSKKSGLDVLLEAIGKDELDDCCLEGKV